MHCLTERCSARSHGRPPVQQPARTPRPAASRPAAQERGRCACGGGCPRCKDDAALQTGPAGAARAAGTDDLDDAALPYPRAAGDAGAVMPADGGGSAAAPAASCCDRAFAAGLARSDYGGVICCNNVKHSCVWPSNMSAVLTNAAARSIAVDCARVHEDTHHDDVDCSGAAVERPNFKAGANIRAEECTAYRAEVACFDARLASCGSNAECGTQIRARRSTKQGQANTHCA